METENKNVSNMVRAVDSISSSFAKLKFVTLACVVGMAVTAIGCAVYSINKVSELGNKVYVLDKGQVLTASREDVAVTREDEVKEQSRRFHTLFFTVSPNSTVLRQNLEQAMRLSADKSVYQYYNDLQESGYYRRFAQAQAVQEIQVDSVIVDMRSYPYRVATFSSLYITRPSLIVKNSLVTRMNMLDVPRDPTNLNGLKIENFEVVRNTEVEKRNR